MILILDQKKFSAKYIICNNLFEECKVFAKFPDLRMCNRYLDWTSRNCWVDEKNNMKCERPAEESVRAYCSN